MTTAPWSADPGAGELLAGKRGADPLGQIADLSGALRTALAVVAAEAVEQA